MRGIIGLYSPRSRSGKTTFAEALAYTVPGTYLTKFAEPMREMAVLIASSFLEGGEQEAWDWIEDGRKDTKPLPGLGVTMRHLLQTLGTEWGRQHIHKDLWVVLCRQNLRRVDGPWCPLAIVDDTRFENEYHMLRDLGAVMVRVVRETPEVTTAPHESEGRLEHLPWDYTIVNDGSVNDLVDKAPKLLKELGFVAAAELRA